MTNEERAVVEAARKLFADFGESEPDSDQILFPTKSRPLFIQMAGRGLRRDPLAPVEEQDCINLTEDIERIRGASGRSTGIRRTTGPASPARVRKAIES